MNEGLGITVTRKNPKIPELIKALSLSQIDKALKKPTQKAAVYVAKNKLMGQVLGIVTGNLRRSILPSVKVKGFIASFGTPLGYGAVHEFGLGKAKKRPWLAPGTEEFVNSGEYIKIFKEELLKELKR